MSNSESLESLMHATAEVARIAGAVALRHYRTALTVETKVDGSPVTIADREAEATAREWITERFPNDGVLGEELGALRPQARRRWVLDPIDGTQTFVRGVPLWGTLVAVMEGDDVLAGAAHFPALGEWLAAALGCGAWWNDSRCRVSDVSALSAATMLTTDDLFPANTGRRARWESLARQVALTRTWGDCYGYLLVATGRAEIMVDDRLGLWDAAALMPAIVEAGGIFTDFRGRATPNGGSAIATNRAIGSAARALLSPSQGSGLAVVPADDAND